MNRRLERARYLGEQLGAAMDALGVATRGSDVVLFLDRLARLEAYPATELAAVSGLPELIAEAASARAEHAAELGKFAGLAFDLDQLLDDGRHLAADDTVGERDGWLRDVLVLATVAPWLTPARRRQTQWALEKAHAMVEGNAEAFLDASVLVFDRRELEAPDGLSDEARAFLSLLADLSLVVAFERTRARPSERRLNAALRRLDPRLVDAADDALADHAERAAVRLPSALERLSLAAADESHATLVRMEAGPWVLIRHRGALRLRFEGDEADVAVAVLEGAEAGPLPPSEARTFPIPLATEGLMLRLRVGPDSRVVHLEAHPG